ncbi:MAG: GTPase Era [Burkholderiales bacterium]|jgi:GTP-binding protein Era|nr:GTPase Era [Burkholderiales bacterium]
MPAAFRAGTIAIVGRPNVGKSTLLNALVGQKLAITSRKPQTTRHRLAGIVTREGVQYVFVDTPGFQTRHRGALNRLLNRRVREVLEGVDVVFFVVEAGTFGAEDRAVLKLLPANVPAVLVVNKEDLLADPAQMLPFLARAGESFPFAAVVPLSAEKRRNLGPLLDSVAPLLPEQPPLFDADALTDRSERFLAAELLREKLFRNLGDEVPYGSAVVIEKFEEEGALRRIHAAIVVARPGHKAIVIGKGGSKLKEIASAARRDMEALFGGKVFLEVWVKVRSGWTESEATIRGLDEAS